MRIGGGKVAIGKSEEFTVLFITETSVICVKLYCLCPAGIPPYKKYFIMPELAAGQNIWVKLNRKLSSALGFKYLRPLFSLKKNLF